MILKKADELKVFVLLLAVTWGSRFYHSRQFGLYEDDHYRIPDTMQWTWREMLGFVPVILGEQASMEEPRFLHTLLIRFFAFLGQQLNGLHAMYVIGYAIVALNVVLFYLLLKRLSGQTFFSICGGLAFALFPADTTQAFLTHAFGVQPALTLLLVGFHLYLSDRKSLIITAYFCLFASLFCYERFFLVFLAAPLLKQHWDKKLLISLARHTLILVAMLLGIFASRRILGEVRVAELGTTSLVKIVTDTITGPFFSSATFFYRPLEAFVALQRSWIIPFAVCFFAIVYVLQNSQSSLQKPAVDRHFLTLHSTQPYKHLARWVVVGLVLLVTAYPLTLIGDVTAVSGRASRVHAAAIVGASVICACFCTAIAYLAGHRWRKLVNVGFAAFFTLLLGFGLIVQQDYITGWQYQKSFWTDINQLCPDLDRDTAVFVETFRFRETGKEQIRPRSAYLNALAQAIYVIPPEWAEVQDDLLINHQPIFYRLKRNWEKHVRWSKTNANVLELPTAAAYVNSGPALLHTINPSNTIVLEAKDGRLIRRTEPLQIEGKSVALKQVPVNLQRPLLAPNVLYPDIINDATVEPVKYLRQ